MYITSSACQPFHQYGSFSHDVDDPSDDDRVNFLINHGVSDAVISAFCNTFAANPTLTANAARRDRQRQPRQTQVQSWEILELLWNQLSPETRHAWSREDRGLRSVIFFSKRPSLPAVKNKDLPTFQRSAHVADYQYDDNSDD